MIRRRSAGWPVTTCMRMKKSKSFPAGWMKGLSPFTAAASTAFLTTQKTGSDICLNTATLPIRASSSGMYTLRSSPFTRSPGRSGRRRFYSLTGGGGPTRTHGSLKYSFRFECLYRRRLSKETTARKSADSRNAAAADGERTPKKFAGYNSAVTGRCSGLRSSGLRCL